MNEYSIKVPIDSPTNGLITKITKENVKKLRESNIFSQKQDDVPLRATCAHDQLAQLLDVKLAVFVCNLHSLPTRHDSGRLETVPYSLRVNLSYKFA